MKPWVICFLGGNFSGKSTQAALFAEFISRGSGYQAVFFDTRENIEPRVYDPNADLDLEIALPNGKSTTLRNERERLEAGMSNTTEWVAEFVVIPKMTQILRENSWVVFPGSPRVEFEGKRFAEELLALQREDVISGCLVVFVDTPKEICFERAKAWYESLTDEVEIERRGYKYENFEDRWEWYLNDTLNGAFAVLEGSRGLFAPRVTVRDDGNRSKEDIFGEVVSKALKILY